MKATIKTIHIENFKGVKDKTFDFNNLPSVVEGKNGSGKTTIADAYYWVFTDKDVNLTSNPNIKPLGVEECTPTVEVTMNIDGKEVEFCKMQKIKTSKPDENGIVKSSSTNTYMINKVPKKEADFKAYLDEIGFPIAENFLIMSHVDVFTGMKNADMRKALFEMVSSHSDKDIAEKLGSVPQLSALLDNYKLEEVEAMNKATMKKIKDQLEGLPSQIEGLEMAKTEDSDTSELELLINSLNEQINATRSNIANIEQKRSDYVSIGKQLLQLDFDRSTELQRMNKIALAGKDEIEQKINRSCNGLVDAKRHFNAIDAELKQTGKHLSDCENKFEELKKNFKNAKALEFDESKTICPCCGQAYPEDKKAEIKDAFEKDKKSKMGSANLQAKTVQGDIKTYEAKIAELMAELDKSKAELESLEAENKQLNQEFENFKPTEVEPTEELKKIDAQIEELTKRKESEHEDFDSQIIEAKTKLSELESQLADANKQIGASSNNVRIDAQIEDLQNKQIELEQTKADCEKILYQVELLAKEKNNVVAEEINSNFDYVEFQLWEMQKNGSLKDACIPQYKGKALGVQTNTALEELMKIDICQGFQKFYNTSTPLFVDGAECFSSDTYNLLECKTQHIYLKVSDGELEVK